MTKLTTEQFEAMLIERHGQTVHQKLKSATVGIAGLGGLGSNVAVSLARIGIGKLVIADFDIVEPSNLNRQQYFVEQLGIEKVTALTENLSKINPYVKIEGHCLKLTSENIPEIFKHCPIIAECFDKAEQKQIIVETALNKTKSVIVAASGIGGYGKSNEILTQKISDRLILIGDGSRGLEAGFGLMAPRVAIAAGHQANAVVELILEN
ncbi:MAG: thiamine biosynthesis protein ThiF [Planctomycetes bacterium GWF2_42_9]|nr:MAG: thiamine biosynthesis protein ThiF [Planctomycetes bacterium GWF2_42_9]HAL44897.1 sulfur carrier protein ThiS adenylyltransferase ThiF [Phycisphaerales bacterium]